MKLPDKTTTMARAIACIRDGDTVAIGGFGVPGTPFALIRALVEHGARGLTIVKNDANEVGMGIDWLLQSGQIARLITSHIGLNPNMIAAMNAARVQVEFCPQGILAERLRIGGAGLPAVLSDIGLNTALAQGKQRVTLPNGREVLVEPAIRPDVALIHAETADAFGNLRYSASARNSNPLAAMAATLTIAEAEAIVPPGALAPDDIHTPGPFVDHVTPLPPNLPEVYGVVTR